MNATFCGSCNQPEVSHHLTACTRCGRTMCPKCLHLPSINAPCHCAECRQEVVRRFNPPRFQDVDIYGPAGADLDEWEAWMLAEHPEVWAGIEWVADLAGTWDSDRKILYAAGKIIADLAAFANDASDAMRNRTARRFDALARRCAHVMDTMPSRANRGAK